MKLKITSFSSALLLATALSLAAGEPPSPKPASAEFARMKTLMKSPNIFDGSNISDLADITEQGFFYSSIGREIVQNHKP